MQDKEQGKTEVQEVNDEEEEGAPRFRCKLEMRELTHLHTTAVAAKVHDIDIAVAEKPSVANTLKIGASPRRRSALMPSLTARHHSSHSLHLAASSHVLHHVRVRAGSRRQPRQRALCGTQESRSAQRGLLRRYFRIHERLDTPLGWYRG